MAIDIVPASADEWPISPMTTQNVYDYSRKSIIWTGNSSDSVLEIIGISNKRPISGKRHFLNVLEMVFKWLESRGWPSMVIVGRPMNSNDPQHCPFDKYLIGMYLYWKLRHMRSVSLYWGQQYGKAHKQIKVFCWCREIYHCFYTVYFSWTPSWNLNIFVIYDVDKNVTYMVVATQRNVTCMVVATQRNVTYMVVTTHVMRRKD